MRIVFANTAHCAKLARTLKKQLSECGLDVPLHAAQNAVGAMMGYRNWHELEKSGIAPIGSPADHAVSDVERIRREQRQITTLVERFELPASTARAIIETMHPTGRRAELPSTPSRLILDQVPGISRSWLEERFHGQDRKEAVDGLGSVRIVVDNDIWDGKNRFFAIKPVSAAVVSTGKVTAWVDGYLVAMKAAGRRSSAEDIGTRLMDATDIAPEDAVDLAGHWLEHQGNHLVMDALAEGTVLFLNNAGRNFRRTKAGDGARLVRWFVETLNTGRFGPIRTLVCDPVAWTGTPDPTAGQKFRDKLSGWLDETMRPVSAMLTVNLADDPPSGRVPPRLLSSIVHLKAAQSDDGKWHVYGPDAFWGPAPERLKPELANGARKVLSITAFKDEPGQFLTLKAEFLTFDDAGDTAWGAAFDGGQDPSDGRTFTTLNQVEEEVAHWLVWGDR